MSFWSILCDTILTPVVYHTSYHLNLNINVSNGYFEQRMNLYECNGKNTFYEGKIKYFIPL